MKSTLQGTGRISIIYFSAVVIIMSKSFAQAELDFIQTGAYLNLYDFKHNEPAYNCNFTFVKNPNDICDYIFYINSYDFSSKISKKTLFKNIFIIKSDSSVYLNCYRFGMGNGYMRMVSFGRYCYLLGKGLITARDKQVMNKAAIAGGLMGAATAVVFLDIARNKPHHYIYDLNTGNLHTLDSSYVHFILERHSDLYGHFLNETVGDSVEVLLKYIMMVNDRSIIDMK